MHTHASPVNTPTTLIPTTQRYHRTASHQRQRCSLPRRSDQLLDRTLESLRLRPALQRCPGTNHSSTYYASDVAPLLYLTVRCCTLLYLAVPCCTVLYVALVLCACERQKQKLQSIAVWCELCLTHQRFCTLEIEKQRTCCTLLYLAVSCCILLYLAVPCCTLLFLAVPCCTLLYRAVPCTCAVCVRGEGKSCSHLIQ